MTVTRVVDTSCRLGEGPVWHPDEKRLYWVDIESGRLHRYDPETGAHDCPVETSVIAGVTIQRDGSLLAFMDRGRVGRVVDGDLRESARIVDSPTRFNDVIADPAGRVFCGTMPSDTAGGRLFRLDTDGTVTTVETGVGIPNGMGFTRDRERFYFTETEASTVYRYAYDEETGAVSARERFVESPETPGLPDGMTVDSTGHIWSARWEGGCVVEYDADGTELGRFDVPTEKVTSVAFGGPDLDSLYVTTAGGDGDGSAGEGDESTGDAAGALFRLDVAATGRPEFRSDARLG
ncbi:pentonolactonase XacC [Haloferax volcanii]|uniref:SMP-30/gluconolactonase/LRE family protein n=1 Tax=Haloferax volcanii TaxID=2246 RepID=A0A558GFA4_HALVO|nr:pentonolactonase XacC [Haloferax volcanii]TVT96442.1 SMP-30/gluconolactonase/LRE family protein [Haloferax volcanii]